MIKKVLCLNTWSLDVKEGKYYLLKDNFKLIHSGYNTPLGKILFND